MDASLMYFILYIIVIIILYYSIYLYIIVLMYLVIYKRLNGSLKLKFTHKCQLRQGWTRRDGFA